MKRYIFFFFIFLTSVSLFFSFNKEVSAVTYNYTISQDMIDFVSDSRFIESINNHVGTWNPYVSYRLNNMTYTYNFMIQSINSANNNAYLCYHNNSSRLSCYVADASSNQVPYIINSDYTLTSYNSSFTRTIFMNNNDPYPLAYFGENYFVINYDSSSMGVSDTINITDNTYTYTCTLDSNNTSCQLPTIYSWYKEHYYVPPVPDDTPILTSFVNLVIDKLSYICEFITSSYIYLSIIVVFILYISILLLRRLQNV